MKTIMILAALGITGLSIVSQIAKPIADTSDLESSSNTKLVSLSLHGKTIQTSVYDTFSFAGTVTENDEILNFGPSSLFTGKYSKNTLVIKTSALAFEILTVSDEAIDTNCNGLPHQNSTRTLCYKVSRIENAPKLNPTHQYDGIVTINDVQYVFTIRGGSNPSQSFMILKKFADS
jgi:hypothetical protein